MLPDFLVIGAQKCGTTALHAALSAHPGAFMCTPKEPHFFSVDAEYRRGLRYYGRYFAGASAGQRVGEASTSYTMDPHRPRSAERIAQHLPEARLIYMVRHPLRRLESAYMHAQIYHHLQVDFATALATIPNILDSTRYWHQIQKYRSFFSDDRILPVFLEDLEREPQAELARVAQFLGLEGRPLAPMAGGRHASIGQRVDGRLLRRLRRGPPLLHRLGRRLPDGLRRIALLTQPLASRPEWSPELRRRVVGELDADARQFLAYCRKPEDLWDLLSAPPGVAP